MAATAGEVILAVLRCNRGSGAARMQARQIFQMPKKTPRCAAAMAARIRAMERWAGHETGSGEQGIPTIEEP